MQDFTRRKAVFLWLMNNEIEQLGQNISSIKRALIHGPDLAAFNRRVLPHPERGDHGELHYTTTSEAISRWAEDPHGIKKFDFMSQAYGIPPEKLSKTLSDMGLGEYVKAKKEGRMVGMISTQILKPTYYFMANALLLGHLTQEHGIPTALMVGTYESDLFFPNNSDKTNAFGNIEFPIDLDPVTHKLNSVRVRLVPVGLKQPDGSMRPISSINDASGQQCDRIMVRVAAATDPKDKQFPTGKAEKTAVPHSDDAEYFTLAALGIHIPQEEISLTDFYKQMWIHTVNALREKGELPSEKDMPMFFAKAETMYHVLGQVARPPETTVQRINTNNAAVGDKNITQLPSGVLTRTSSGVMDPSWYYPMQYALPDLYYECSSCGGDKFVSKLINADRLIESYGLHSPEVRIPDKEVPELETLCVHPSGTHLDMMSVRQEVETHTSPVLAQIQAVQKHVTRGILEKSSGRHQTAMLQEELNALRKNVFETVYNEVRRRTGHTANHMSTHAFVIPPIIAATYRALLGDVSEATQSHHVKQAIRHFYA